MYVQPCICLQGGALGLSTEKDDVEVMMSRTALLPGPGEYKLPSTLHSSVRFGRALECVHARATV